MLDPLRLVSVVCAVICCSKLVVEGGTTSSHLPDASSEASSELTGSLAGFIEASEQQEDEERTGVGFLSGRIMRAATEGYNNGNWGEPSHSHAKHMQVSPGHELRRLGAEISRGSKGSTGGRALASFLIFLGSLVTASASWLKTSELYHSPKQALRRAKMRLLGQMPPSWDDYVRSLQVLDELVFPELCPLLRRLEKKPVVLMSVPQPSLRLSEFLNLTDKQREEGIVIKAKSTSGCTAKEAAFELFAHEKLAKGLPFSLACLGVYRDVDASTLYLITPRARADVALFTRRMPDKVKLRLAFAEMIYGLWGMHSKGWVHRDIKGCNYFVSHDGHALLADFEGFWRNNMHAIMYGDEVEIIFTKNYISPELTFDGEFQVFDIKSDVYALGVTFKEMLEWMGQLPVPKRKEAEDLIKHMLEADAQKRYDLKQCMEHPYFDGLDFDRLETHAYGKAFEGNYMTPYKFLR